MSFAMVFLSCRGDASAAVDQSEVDITHRIASSFDQHASLLKHQCSHLFDYRRPRRLSNQAGVSLSQIADPTTRRAALWLVMQVIVMQVIQAEVVKCLRAGTQQCVFAMPKPLRQDNAAIVLAFCDRLSPWSLLWMKEFTKSVDRGHRKSRR
jgi:hypothetical protein